MIESFNVPKNQVAKWAGLTSAVFSLSQALTGVSWGAASDKLGRKPVIMIGLGFTMMMAVFFGLSQSLTWALLARAFQGACNGNVGIIRTMVAEMVPQKELQPRAFSIMPLVWTIGSIFGPALGGGLANPAANYPKIFGKSTFFLRFPFVLPNLVASAFFLTGITTGTLFLRETLESKRRRTDYGLKAGKALTKGCKHRRKQRAWADDEDEANPFLAEGRNSTPSTPVVKTAHTLPPKKARLRDVFSPQSNVNLIVYTLLAMHSVAYDQLLPIFMHHPTQSIRDPEVNLPLKFAGGFGIDHSRIGLLFVLYGTFGMFIQFLVFPPFARKFGVLNCLRACGMTFPIVYFLTPFTALFSSAAAKQGAMFALMLCKCWTVIFAFPCSTILLTNSAASLSILGTLNGVATSISALGRAAGPFLSGAAFTLGADIGYVILPWWFLGTVALIAFVPMLWLKEMEGFAADPESEHDSDEEEESAVPLSPTHDRRARRTTLSSDVAVGDEDAGPQPLSPTLTRQGRNNGKTKKNLERRMSSPIGMGEGVGPGDGRRYSSNLGPTRSGFGTGGSSFH
ncbi:MAG: hypothetical protein Q9227_000025 [Pyrenula ochraceoflavens]